MTANYPSSLDSYTTKVDGVDRIMAAHVNGLQDAVVAIETELGTDPAGSKTDVKTRLNDVDTLLSDMDALLSILSGDGWLDFSPTLTYASFSGILGTFTIAGDYTATFRRKRPIKLVQNSVTKYFYVVSSVYSSPNTTVTITGGNDYTLENLAISGVKIGLMDNPSGFPWAGGHVPLKTALTSTSFDGDTFSETAKTLIDLSTVFGVPDNVTEVQIRLLAWDSASSGSTNCWVGVSPNNTANDVAMACWLAGNPNNIRTDVSTFIPCNLDGNVYYQVKATGTLSTTIYMSILSFTL